MAGVAYTSVQPNGITTNWVTILSVYWQPQQSANIQLGFYTAESDYQSGYAPVYTLYFPLNISVIDPTQALPPQIIAQCIASNGPCPGGTLTS
jgi:hypothetical protein